MGLAIAPSGTWELLPALCSGVACGGIRGTVWYRGLNPGLLQAKHTLSSLELSLWPAFFLFKFFLF